MSRKRNTILQAQEEYLQKGNPRALERLYRELLMLGFYILARQGKYQDEEDAIDIATDLCMRLMEKKTPVINGAPSAYIKMALFYKQKPRNAPEDLDDKEDEEARQGSALWDYIDKVCTQAGLCEDNDVDMLARQTMEMRTNWRLVYRNIQDPVLKQEYKQRMKEIEQCVRSSASSRGVVAR